MMMWIKEIIIGGLKSAGEYSEKRISKATIIFVLLLCTLIDLIFFSKSLRLEILLPWLSLCGYDGYRMTAEKKIAADSAQPEKTTQ